MTEIQRQRQAENEAYMKNEEERFRQKPTEAMILREQLEACNKQRFELMELVSNLVKDGFTYDQVNRKMLVCEKCGDEIRENL